MDDLYRYQHEDGSVYSVDMQLPDDLERDKYQVDMVRHSMDEYGFQREQRQTLAEYKSYGEAEEHLYEAEEQLQKTGLDDFDLEAMADLPYSDEPILLPVVYPPDAEDEDIATAQLLAFNSNGLASKQLAQGDAETIQDIVSDLDTVQASAGTEQVLAEAQELAEINGQHPAHTPLFQPEVETHSDALPFALGDKLQPFDNEGQAIPHLVDGSGTAHWFGIVKRDAPDADSHELRYFRAREAEDGIQHDSHPVMPLSDAERESAWVLPDLERHLQAGNIYTAQQMAHNVADFYEQEFPDPLDLPSLNPEPEYYFGYGVGPNDQPSLEAVKTWMDGSERRFDTLTISEYGMFDEAAVNEQDLETLMDEQGVEAAMNLAESMAVDGGYLDPERDDSRIFFEDDAPPESFTTNRDHELANLSYSVEGVSMNEFETEEFPTVDYTKLYKNWGDDAEQMREANEGLEGTDWFEATFDDGDLLEPLDPTVNYALVVEASDPWTLELAVEKVWKADDGFVGFESQTIQTYDPDEDRETAEADRDALREVYDERGLEAMMHRVELQAMQNGYLEAGRTNSGLFSDGPPDRFETLAQQLEGETNPYWNTDGEIIDEPESENPVENPYWRLDTLPVNDPDGEPLGHAMHIVVYDGIENNLEQIGAPHIPEDEPFCMLEMAHFETTEAAEKFGKEFNGYLIPGLLEGPELAEEVARLEELPVEWKTLEGDDLNTYQNGELALTHEASDWHPYNPNAERDARIEAEGLYTDPIQQVGERDEGKNEPGVELASQDLNL